MQNKNQNSAKLIGSYTRAEEVANSITHGIGAGLSIAGLSLLVVLASMHGDVWRVVSFSIYGATLVILYLASTIYHGLPASKAKNVFQIIDHVSIYLLIAGTYTPLMLVNLKGGWGWSIFGVIWGLALLGITIKAIFLNRFKKLSVIIYVTMGWICIIALKEMLIKISLPGLIWLGAGGILYTSGIAVYVWERLPYNHAIWHLFVIAGSICHYFTILLYILPMPDAS